MVQIAKSQAVLFGATEDFLVTRQFRVMSTPEQREELLHCSFRGVGCRRFDLEPRGNARPADRSRARNLRREFIAVRSNYNDKRRTMKDPPGGG